MDVRKHANLDHSNVKEWNGKRERISKDEETKGKRWIQRIWETEEKEREREREEAEEEREVGGWTKGRKREKRSERRKKKKWEKKRQGKKRGNEGEGRLWMNWKRENEGEKKSEKKCRERERERERERRNSSTVNFDPPIPSIYSYTPPTHKHSPTLSLTLRRKYNQLNFFYSIRKFFRFRFFILTNSNLLRRKCKNVFPVL